MIQFNGNCFIFRIVFSIGLVERLLRAGIDVSSVDTIVTKNTPLHWAASFGSAHIAQVLLEQVSYKPEQL